MTLLGPMAKESNLRTCRGCGCDDNNACMTPAGPCAWVLLDIPTPTGICSSCADEFEFSPQMMLTASVQEYPELYSRVAVMPEWLLAILARPEL